VTRVASRQRGAHPASHTAVEAWFSSEGWTAFEFQRACWEAYLAGRCGLLHAPTGNGKTLAAWLGPAIERLRELEPQGPRGCDTADPIRVLWLTPLRALASDTAKALHESAQRLGLPWTVQLRTGDTSSSVKAKQREHLPTALVTTPESLTILLSYADSARRLGSVRCIVVDEWHELMGTKRGVQTELALARMRRLSPGVRTWGLSATLGNIDEAARVLVGSDINPVIVRGAVPKRVQVETILPDEIERYPFTGHIGVSLADKVIDAIERAGTTLLFTNTRSQAEIWFRTLIRARPDLIGSIALHHGSLDRDIRTEVESMLRAGGGDVSRLRCVVSTSSLDLGVDFSPVDQVIQIGSPKGIARLIQRAGRSGHRPGAVSRILCVPSHAFELVEFASVRDGVASGAMESRAPIRKPLDVLAQHLVTCAMGGGFDEQELLSEARATHAYEELTEEEWAWAMDFVRRGGSSLEAYPEYSRITFENGTSGVVDKETGELVHETDERGRWRVSSRRIATLHRMGIGTIVADAGLRVQFQSGKVLGTIEESFITRLRSGDRFVFAGRVLELVRVREMTAFVKRATRTKGVVPRWNGGKMPLSTQLAAAVRRRIALADDGVYQGPEMATIRPLLERQKGASRLPRPDELLIERIATREGHHAFVYPFAGRLAHEGLGAVLSLRLSRPRPASFRATVTDYGIELFCEEPFEVSEQGWRELLSSDRLVEDLLESMNATQLARRHFREVARIAGLTHQGYPGAMRPARQLQASSEMFFDVFEQFDPGNMLLTQAKREVLEGQLEFRRIRDVLDTLSQMKIVVVELDELTPMSFPLWAESLRATTVSSETWEQRVRKMVVKLEKETKARA